MQNISSNNQYLLTVIIPFYNIGKQINKCIKDSIKFKMKKLKLFSLTMVLLIELKKYLFSYRKKSNYKLLKLKNNKGPGIARNKGIYFLKASLYYF